MKKSLLTLAGLFFIFSNIFAGGGWADCAVNLTKDGGASYSYSLANENWADGIWVLNTGFDGYSFGTPTSLVLNGGIGNAWTDDFPGYTATSFILYYRVYKSTATPGSWSQIALDNVNLKNGNNYVYDKNTANINILALATLSGTNTYVLEVAMSKRQYFTGGSWNSMIPGDQSVEYSSSVVGYKATFTKTVGAGSVPAVTGISPTSGTTTGGTSVTITGTNFTGATSVTIGGVAATGVSVVSATTITATTPAGTAGVKDVVVTSPGGSGTGTNLFTYVAALTVETFESFSLGATGFTSNSVPFTLNPSSGFKVDIYSGYGYLSSNNYIDNLTSNTNPCQIKSTSTFTVKSLYLYPSAYAGGDYNQTSGVNVTFTGKLAGATKFTFSPPSSDFASASWSNATNRGFSLVNFATPGYDNIPIDELVITLGGSTIYFAIDNFTWGKTTSIPTVTGISPTSGSVAGGTSVVITGTNFTGATAVKFGSTIATSYTVNSATQITATSPAGTAGTVDITVTTAGGTSATSSADQFTYAIPVPTISSFSPASGAMGTTVTITGTNFNIDKTKNIVFFGATMATVSAANATSLTVTVPAGATYQPISVTDLTTGLTASSAQVFITTFSCGGFIDATSFALNQNLTTGTNPYCVSIGDLDGDGKPDLIVTNKNDNTISVYRNTSTAGIPSFASKQNFTTGTGPYSVSIGDIDGDGKPDLAVSNFDNNSISILRNTSTSGTISFAAKQDLTTGSWPISISISDLDTDGKPDLAVLNNSASTVSIFKNISYPGSISFAAKQDLSTGEWPLSISTADLDGDGKLEIVVENENSNTLSLYKNTSTSGSISFAAKQDLTTGISPYNVSIGDMDGDGKPDLVLTNYASINVSVYRNTSTIGVLSFAPNVNFSTGTSPYFASIGDLDGDGKPDLAVTNSENKTVSVLKNTSTSGAVSFSVKQDYATGNFPFSISIGDLDGDGRSDMSFVNQNDNTVSIFRNTEGCSVSPTVTSISPVSGPVGTAVTINGSGFSTTPADNTVWFGAVKATVNTSTANKITITVPAGAGSVVPVSVRVGGLAAYSNTSATPVFTLTNTPNIIPGFIRSNITTGEFTSWLTNQDLNNDGYSDLVVVLRGSDNIGILLGDGSGGFGTLTKYTVNRFPYSVAIDDFNSDGKKDLAVACNGTDYVGILLGNGDGSFGSMTNFTAGSAPEKVVSGDFNGDGKSDLATTNFITNQITILLGNGAGSFSAATSYSLGGSPLAIAIGDFNKDGIADLCTANNNTSGTISVLLGNGNGTFGAVTAYSAGNYPHDIVIYDFNGDGNLDLACGNAGSTSKNISVYPGNGNGNFGAATDYALNAGPYSMGIADFNGDGKADLASANINDGSVCYMLGDGTGAFGTVTKILTETPNALTIGDFNGDGKADMATADFTANNISVLLNANLNSAPSDIALTASSINENVAANSTVGTLSTTDPDAGNTFTYTLVAGTGSTDNASFNISGGSLRITSSPDFETKSSYSVRIRTTDQGSLFFEKAFTITINDISEAPLATTNAAGSITSTGATLNGSINANNASTAVTFEYGLTTSYGSTVTADQSPVTGISATSVSKAITGLTPGTLYHYRVVGVNTGGTTNGADQTFTILGTPPTLSTTAITTYSATSATMGGNVTDEGSASVTERGIVYSSTDATPTIAEGATKDINGSGLGSFSKSINGLTPGKTYYVSAYATSTGGTTYGVVQSFTTGKSSVLVVASAYQSDVVAKLVGTSLFSKVDYIGVTASLPDLATLQAYNSILFYMNTSGPDLTTLGNNLATYIEGGGGVVTATFAHKGIMRPGGKFDTDYALILNTGQTQGQQLTLGTINLPGHPLMQGVTTFDGGSSSYRASSVSLTSGTQVAAQWSNGDPLIVFKTGVGPKSVNRVDLNFFPKSSDISSDCWVSSTDGARIMANALLFVAGNVDCNSPTAGGTIAADQNGCTPFNPVAITSSSLPTGHTGTLEYKWQSSTTSNSAGFSDISSSNSESYDPASLTLTTWYKRLARVSCKTDWAGAAESNVIAITVKPNPVATATPSSAAINSGVATNIVLTSVPTGAAFGWTAATASGTVTGASASSGTTIAQTLSGSGVVNYTVTPLLNSCSGTSITVAITVNGAPTDMALSASAINENVAGNSTVGTLSSTDPDAGNTFTYTLVAGTGSTDNASFNISGSSLRITASPDFETKSSYSVRVRTTDQGSLYYEKAFTITINDLNETPTDIALSSSSINENVAANSTVGTLSSTDVDASNTFTYTLVAGTGSTDNASFNISGSSLRITASPDFETKSSYSVRIRTTDQGSLYYEKAFTITINDLADAPTVTTQLVSSITSTTATGNGNITSLGIPNPTQYGVVWSTSTNPTVALTTKTAQGAIGVTGAFTSSITGLTENTTYYVKAYATNTAGTSYGNEVSFTTPLSCVNPATGGSITADQNGCAPFNPDAVTSVSLPTGHTGTLEYQWQSSTTGSSSGFSIIPSSNSVSYDPAALTQTTWYKRLARVTCKADWAGAAESNVIKVTVNPLPVPAITGLASACASSSGNIYSTEAGMTGYSWSVSAGGTISDGDGTNTITVDWNTVGDQTVSVNYENTSNCMAASSTVYPVSVNPVATVNTVDNQVLCSGSSTLPIGFSGSVSGSVFEWTNDNASIGLASSGLGDIPSFVATNTGTAPVTATITVKPASTEKASTVFDYTGAVQTWTVPAGVTSIDIEAYGARGGSGAAGGNASSGGSGGKGTKATGTLSVVPGQVLNIYIGGRGNTPTAGFNGGGNGGTTDAGGGGGASDIRYPGNSVTDRLIVAAGGGGGGRGGCEPAVTYGGAGGDGDMDGTNGASATTPGGYAGGGFAGVGKTGGLKGIGCPSFSGLDGINGILGLGGDGGNGQNCCCLGAPSQPGGGGGGGGYFGGGGGGGGSAGTVNCTGNDKGGGGGGAGGTSFIGGVTNGTITTGVPTGDGMIVISYQVAKCAGPETTFTITVNPNPAEPIAQSNNYTYTGTEYTASANVGANETIDWYSDLAGGNIVSAPSGTDAGAYSAYAKARNLTTRCVSASRTLVTLEITKVLLTVAADAKIKVYGEVNPELTFKYSGFVNGEDENVLDTKPVASTMVNVATAVGTYNEAITIGSGADNNYDFNYVSNTFDVTKALLTVTADAQTKVYGEANPELTFKYSGFVNGNDESVLDTKPIASTMVNLATAVGTYTEAITIGSGADNNYDLNYVSNTFDVTKALLTVTADAQTKVYGDANPELTFKYSGFVNGNDESVLDTKPIASTMVNLATVVGTYTDAITVDSGSDKNYNFKYVSNTFDVTKALLTVTADAQTKVYGEANPELTFKYSGFVNGNDEDVLDIKPVTSTLVDLATSVGTYTEAITIGSGSDKNYDFKYVSNTFDVTKAMLTVTADFQTKVYGEANPVLTFKYSGFVNGDDESVLDTKPIASTTVDLVTAVGIYTDAITIGSGSDNNYDFKDVANTFGVTKAMLTVTANFQTKVYGEANPELTFKYSGFLNGDDENVLDIKPVASTIVDQATAVGTYTAAITLDSGVDNNYDFKYMSNTFDVSKAMLTVTADAKIKVYGEANPELTFTYSGFLNGDDESVLDIKPVASTIVDQTTAVGTYSTAITIGSGVDNNYDFKYVANDFEVTKAVLTVTADTQTKVYGEANPELTFKYSGFVNGDKESVLDTKPVASTTVDLTTAVGTYPGAITVTAGDDNNYEFTYVANKFDVTKALLTISGAVVGNKVYDGNTDAVLTDVLLTGVVAGDDVALENFASGTFAQAGIGTGIDVTAAMTISGAASGNYTLTQPVGLKADITAKEVHVTNAVATNKVYDGTANAVITGATLTGVVGTENVVLSDAATGTFTQVGIGSDIEVIPSMTITGTGISNYTLAQPTGLKANITARPLTVINPVVVTNKMVDGNTTAVVTSPGTLQGVVSSDLNNVVVSAIANYNDASVGVNKTITVVYTLNGNAMGNYVAPVNFVISGAKISDFVVLSPVVTPTPGCEGSDLELAYTLVSGSSSEYKITFNAAALAAGIQNVAYTNMPTTANNGVIMIPIPKGTPEGNYQGTLQMRNELGFESPEYTFSFTVNLSSDYIIDKFDDVVLCDNSSNRFTTYQWYKNGVKIEGATKQFYCDPAGRVGVYSLEVVTIDGKTLISCGKGLNIPTPKKVLAYPNPMKSNEVCTVKIFGFTDEELKTSELKVFSLQGVQVYQTREVTNLNLMKLPAVPGVYIGHVNSPDGIDYVFKIVVQQ